MSSSFFNGWIANEGADQDVIKVKRIYIDICGNLTDAVLFSQIMYWHGKNRSGKSRLQVQRGGFLWLAKRYEDWWKECRVNVNTARDSIKRLCEIGLLEKRIFHFDGTPTVHVRVKHEKFQELISAALDAQKKAEEAESSAILRIPSDVNDGIHRFHPTESVDSYTETTTETTTEKDQKPPAQAPPVEAAEESQAPIEKPLTPHQRMFGAICDAWGYNLAAITKSKRGQINGAVGELMDTNATPEDMPAFKAWLEAQVSSGKWRSYTVSAMAKYWADFEKEYHAPPPAPIRWDYGDVTQEDIQDEIVAEFRAKLATPGAFDDRLTPEERDAQELAA